MLKKRVKLNKTGIIVIIILIIIITLFFLVFKDAFKNQEKEKMILNFESRVQQFNDLEESNITKYGWLQVQGTKIDVPILKVVEPMGEYSHGWVSTNSIGMKTRNVIIGHNVLNVSSSPMVNEEILTDFEDLMAFVYYDFAKENMYISLTVDGVDKIYIIYAVGFYDYNYDRAEGLNDAEEIESYIKMVKEKSIYKYDVEVNKDDNLLTIKTCTRYFGNDEKQQFVLDARELKDGELPLKYNVKKTELYKDYKLVDSYKKNNEL